jgi:RHS repeat-associated protein
LSGSLEGAGGIGGLLARSSGYSSGNFSTHNYYHADGNGNITYLETSAQGLAASYRYDAFGNLLNSSGSYATANTYRFSSKEWMSAVNGYYYLYRFYIPSLQRWLNQDPIQEWGGINLYEYVGNNPDNLIDSKGLQIMSTSQCHPFLMTHQEFNISYKGTNQILTSPDKNSWNPIYTINTNPYTPVFPSPTQPTNSPPNPTNSPPNPPKNNGSPTNTVPLPVILPFPSPIT